MEQGMPNPFNQAAPERIGPREFIALMAMLMSLQALSIDAMLPALGEIAADLKVSDPNDRQLVVGLFLLGSGIGSLLPGALADRYGRRPVLLVSLACYIAMAVASALVQDFTALLACRVIQAISSAGLAVLPGAIIRDRFEGDRMARMMSTITVVFMIVPMIAPSYGQAVMQIASWRWIFGGMAVMALVAALWVWLRLPETLRPEFRQEIRPATIAGNMWLAASNRQALGYMIGGAMLTGAMFGYINSSQQLVAEHFGAGDTFPLIFAAMAGGMAIANFSNSRIVERFGARRVSHTALLLFIAVSAVQVWQAFQPGETLWQFLPLMAANICLIGFTGANFGSIALQPFARMAGAAASFQAFSRMALGALIGAWIGHAFDGSARPLALGLLGCGLSALLLVLYSERGRLFRRLIPPGQARQNPDPGLR
ncbi:MAG: multidrug effflux MFS transporter [Novosphingobium sp.]|nr:multidrug effflux MFS transporter [Novosphingobium sp.]MBK9011911.1 multidrug effflux MFS transporter [Novosphingobium sp.]